VMAAPWSLHPATRVVIDNPDTHLYAWTLGWDAHAFATDPLAIFDANIYFPYANTLAYSENMIGSAFIAAPIIWLTGDLVLALNLVLLVSCMLCGLGAYVLGRRLAFGTAGAIIAGLVFAFAPTRFFRMSQLHLNAVQWMPFALAWLHGYLDGGRARDLRLALAFFTLQALTSGHGAVMLGVAMVALVLYRLAGDALLAPLRRAKDVGVAGVLLLAPAVLVLLPYRRAKAEIGLDRSLERWGVTPESFLASPSIVHQYLLSLVTSRDLTAAASAFLFPGYLVLILAGIALWPVPARAPVEPAASGARQLARRDVWFYGLLTLLSLSFFAGGPFDVWAWVHAWPGFSFIRVPSRFMILTTLALAVLAGAGFDRLMAGATAKATLLAGAALSVLLLAEYSAYPFTGVPFRVPAPAIVAWLATQPAPFVVAEVPVPRASNGGAFERFQTAAMLHSTGHWQKTIHGYSGIQPPRSGQVFDELTTFPDDRSVATLRALGVTVVVVHRPRYSDDVWSGVEARLRAMTGLRFMHAEADGVIYAVIPAP
jgi:hypothetical protein